MSAPSETSAATKPEIKKAKRMLGDARHILGLSYTDLPSKKTKGDKPARPIRQMLSNIVANLDSILARIQTHPHATDALRAQFRLLSLQLNYYESLLREAFPTDYEHAEKSGVISAVTTLEIPADTKRHQRLTKLMAGANQKRQLCMKALSGSQLLYRAAASLDIDLGLLAAQIIRSITFPPHAKQGVIGILNYFSRILAHKYPNVDVGVTVEQKADKVTLIIDTPEGQKEIIEHEFAQYGLVVVGELAPEAYLNDSFEALSLKHKLELAGMEIRQTQQLLYTERKQYEARITQLEEDIHFLRDIFDKDRYERLELVSALRPVLENAHGTAQAALQGLLATIERGIANQHAQEEIKQQLITLKETDRPLFKYVEEVFVRGAVSNAAGNVLFTILQSISGAL